MRQFKNALYISEPSNGNVHLNDLLSVLIRNTHTQLTYTKFIRNHLLCFPREELALLL